MKTLSKASYFTHFYNPSYFVFWNQMIFLWMHANTQVEVE